MVDKTARHEQYTTRKSRAFADALRGTTPQTAPTHTPQPAPLTTLSATVVDILKSGTGKPSFRVGAVGRALGKMQDDGLIEPGAKPREWVLTPKGEAAYQTHLAQVDAATDRLPTSEMTGDVINLNDPALKPKGFEVLDFDVSPEAVAAMQQTNVQHLRKIEQLNKSLDDMGELADTLTKRIKELEFHSSPIDNQSAKLIAFHAEIVKALAEMKADDKHSGSVIEWVQGLRDHAVTANQIPVTDWYTLVIAQIADLMLNDGSITITGDDMLTDPAAIARYVAMLRQSVRDIAKLADDRAESLDQRDIQIEGLRREIETLNTQLIIWQKEYNAVKRHDQAARILDDLCEMLPEIELYREGQEISDKAIEDFKAKRKTS